MLSLPLTSPNEGTDGIRMALLKKYTDNISFSKPMQNKLTCDNVNTPKEICLYDEVDNPQPERCIAGNSKMNPKLFETMKRERNRLNSFGGKWPLLFIKSKDLAESGFFYLQSEDKVQCAFCYIILHTWRVGDKPLKEHIKRSPKCPFLMKSNVGNVPLPRPKSSTVFLPELLPTESIHFATSPLDKQKHPRMSSTECRLVTYKDWPLIMLSPRELVECGLYYTGVSDVVTCFHCGGSLGNWELDDDPWVEHAKFFPHCVYLVKKQRNSNTSMQGASTSQTIPQTSSPVQFKPNDSLHSEIVRQACEIFSPTLVQKVVLERLKEGGQRLTSLQELCDQILEYKENDTISRIRSFDLNIKENPEVALSDPVEKKNEAVNRKEIKDALLCKICMDQEMGIVFQPCGHLVSCPKCAMLLFNCPLCRTPVTNKVRTYLS